MRDAEAIRRDFLLAPEIAHLNHGSFGAAPLPVLHRQAELRSRLESGPVAFLTRELPGLLDETRAAVAAHVGAADRGSLVFLANATAALNAAATSVPLGRGDEILVSSLEYGAMRLLWEEVAARRGARVVVAEVGLPAEGPDELADAIWRHVTPRTRALFFSHVTSETALVLPVAELCRRARDSGVTTVVDGAHAPGQLDLDLDGLGADCYAGNGHKWLCAPKGAAFLYASETARDWLVPPVVSWGRDRVGEPGFQERFAWSGTSDPTAVLSLPAAIAYQEENGWPAQRARCAALARATQDELLHRHGGEPLAPGDLQAPQMVSFPFAHPDAAALQRMLMERFRVEIPAIEAGPGGVLLRLSVQAYVTERDCDRLLDALDQVARKSVPESAKSR